MEFEDGLRRRRDERIDTIGQFKDGAILVSLVSDTERDGTPISMVTLEHRIPAKDGEAERLERLTLSLDDFGRLIDRALDVARDREGISRIPTPRALVAGYISEGILDCVLFERTSKRHETKSYLCFEGRRASEEGGPFQSNSFMGELTQLAGIHRAAKSMDRVHEREREAPRLSLETRPTIAGRLFEAAEHFLHVVRYIGCNENNEHVVSIARSFPESKRTEAQIFADKSARLELLPMTSFKELPAKSSFSISANDFAEMEKETPKLQRQARDMVHKSEVEGRNFIVGIWGEPAWDAKIGTEVKWDEGRDYRGEPQDFRVLPVGTQKPQSSDAPPLYVLVRKDGEIPPRHEIVETFETREGAIAALREREGPPLSFKAIQEMRQAERRGREFENTHQLDLSKESFGIGFRL